MRYETALANRLGNRSSNQDRAAIVVRDQSVLLLVADGMGGHARGELAAEIFVDAMSDSFYRSAVPIPAPAAFLGEAFARAHQQILEVGVQQRPPVQPRTTAVACLIQRGRAWWAHVGDSRAYWIRGQEVIGRTRDHTYVEELRHHGAISAEQMLTHPLRNYVTHCLGGPSAPPVAVSSEPLALQIGDRLLLCTDGLWGALPEAAFLPLLGQYTLERAVERMADQAERAAYPSSDNITVAALGILADMEVETGAGEERAGATPTGDAQDQLSDAIEQIREAIKEYQDELKKP